MQLLKEPAFYVNLTNFKYM